MSERGGIGDNGGPRIEKFTAKNKIDRIRDLLEMDITATQKCVGIGIVVEADTDGIAAEISTKRLQTFASVSDRETVYRATKVLEEEAVAKAIKVKGKPNSYRVLPMKVIDAIVEAYNQTKVDIAEASSGSPLKPDTGSPSEPDGIGHGHPVGFQPTTPVSPVGSGLTGRVSPDVPSRANIESPSEINNTNPNNKLASHASAEPPGLAGLNGSAEPMIADIVGWMVGGDVQSARNWLKTFLGQYAQDVVRESYFALKTDIAEGKLIAQPLRVWSKIAARLKAEPKRAGGPEVPATPARESTRESIRRFAEEAEAKMRAKRGIA